MLIIRQLWQSMLRRKVGDQREGKETDLRIPESGTLARAPERRSPGHPLVERILRLRLSQGITHRGCLLHGDSLDHEAMRRLGARCGAGERQGCVAMSPGLHPDFSPDPAAPWGITLETPDRRLAWTLDSYLDGFAAEWQTLIPPAGSRHP